MYYEKRKVEKSKRWVSCDYDIEETNMGKIRMGLG
jgi:hypothetical protein